MKQTLKNVKGITLIALVITIVILLILAGISISALNQTGLLEKAKLVEQQSKEAAQNQTITLGEYENQIQKHLSSTRNNEETYTILFDDSLEANETKNLTDDISNYKKLQIRYKWYDSPTWNVTGFLNTFLDYDFKHTSHEKFLSVNQNSDSTDYYICKYIYFPTNNSICCYRSYTHGYPNISMTIFGFKNY